MMEVEFEAWLLCGEHWAEELGLPQLRHGASHCLLVFTVTLLSPFMLQEGEVVLLGNESCNTLYRQRQGQGSDYVHEEMLCAEGLSTGKSICHVSRTGTACHQSPRTPAACPSSLSVFCMFIVISCFM